MCSRTAAASPNVTVRAPRKFVDAETRRRACGAPRPRAASHTRSNGTLIDISRRIDVIS
jgi:hypothetical protein